MDQKLRGIAARRAALDAEEAHLLRYAEELKLWRGFGFGSLLEYMERAMGYAPHTATERLRVARAIAELPLVAEALENGELAHSAVRELSRVAVPETEGEWLEAARGKSLREIEAMVSGHKPGDLPTDQTEPRLHRRTITMEVSPETYDIWRKLHALAAEEHGQRLSDDQLIPSVFRRAYGNGNGSGSGNGSDNGHGDRGQAGSPAYKLAIKQCPDCKRAWQFSGGRDIEIDPVVAECAACDAVQLGSLDAEAPERATTTVTPRKREQVLARDGYCCAVPGCRRNVGLDVHHIEYQSHGGGHELRNTVSICDLHHRAIHYGKLAIRGTAPDHLTFEFRKPRDRRNVTDDDPPPIPGASPNASAPPARVPTSPAAGGPAARSHVGAGHIASASRSDLDLGRNVTDDDPPPIPRTSPSESPPPARVPRSPAAGPAARSHVGAGRVGSASRSALDLGRNVTDDDPPPIPGASPNASAPLARVPTSPAAGGPAARSHVGAGRVGSASRSALDLGRNVTDDDPPPIPGASPSDSPPLARVPTSPAAGGPAARSHVSAGHIAPASRSALDLVGEPGGPSLASPLGSGAARSSSGQELAMPSMPA